MTFFLGVLAIGGTVTIVQSLTGGVRVMAGPPKFKGTPLPPKAVP